jgi:hypothetical protein
MTAARLVALARAAAREPDASHVFERPCALRGRPAATLLRAAARLLAGHATGVGECRGGVVVTGNDEAALARATDLLRGVYGASLHVGSTRARRVLVGTGADPQIYEPVMGVDVQCRWDQVDAVRRDLQRRGGRIASAGVASGSGTVRATCRAEALLGYARQLQELTRGAARVSMTFSHLDPVAADPPEPSGPSAA